MRRATDSEKLMHRLIGLECRAGGMRPTAPPGSVELRQMETEHAALLGEWLKVVVRERLATGRRPVVQAVQGADPLADRRAVLTASMVARFVAWDADAAAGRALPEPHDAGTHATIILERNR